MIFGNNLIMAHNNHPETYDVAIIGGGITGTALLYVLARYTNISRIVLIEKRTGFAEALSHPKRNSQTLHFGDIETNYTRGVAQSVKEAAEMIVRYAGVSGEGSSFLFSYPKMV